jgi:hypothetical protein
VFHELIEGEVEDARRPEIRDALAEVARLGATIDPAGLPVADTPVEALWPVPHRVTIDYGRPGGEWIDERALAARAVIADAALPLRPAHSDFSTKNVLFGGGRVRGVIDWDSLVAASEAEMVGRAAATFTAGWGRGCRVSPTPDEATAFVRAVEAARGRRYDELERWVINASADYITAMVARQSAELDRDEGPRQNDFQRLLRESETRRIVPF